jgi:hypothetical protein
MCYSNINRERLCSSTIIELKAQYPELSGTEIITLIELTDCSYLGYIVDFQVTEYPEIEAFIDDDIFPDFEGSGQFNTINDAFEYMKTIINRYLKEIK